MNALSLICCWILSLLAFPLALAVTVFATQVLAAARPPVSGELRTKSRSARARLVVIVPAHNEATGIELTLRTVLPQLLAGDRVLVVADNCTDDTADKARAAGADVVERFNDSERGKGFALAHGVDVLRSNPPGMVVILDADCQLSEGALDALAERVADTGRPAQALYLMLAPAQARLPRRLAQFAWRVRNWVRPAGWHRIGLPCQLMGTGMAFTWPMLREAPLANASIVEDMKLGIDLAIGGRAPVFCQDALVTSVFPETAAATATQRTRWEHGHLEMILREVPPMLAAAWRRRDGLLAGLALDLCVPPLALLAASLLASTLLSGLVSWWVGNAALLAVNVLLLGVFGFAAFTAWWLRGRDLVRLTELLSIPIYILAKLPLYVRFVVRREKRWVRTDRDES
jgi:cellulose synthase/poly-beta-1,6-N-acetylglucosamine synthase-like glycosyltransferase